MIILQNSLNSMTEAMDDLRSYCVPSDEVVLEEFLNLFKLTWIGNLIWR